MKKQKCINPACKLPRFALGLCKPEYQASCRLIRSGQTTRAALQAAGKCLPKATSKSGSRKDWLMADFLPPDKKGTK